MYYIGVDIGGTFTDCVLVDREGNHRTAKTLSTKDDPVAGVLAGLERLAETVGVDLATLLERGEPAGKGGVELDIDAAAERIGRMIAEYELDAVAIALLWSFANPAHEKALAQAVPDVFVSSSAEVSPRLGEYERTVATVLNS